MGRSPPSTTQAIDGLTSHMTLDNLDRVKILLDYCTLRLRRLKINQSETYKRCDFDRVIDEYGHTENVQLMTLSGRVIDKRDPRYKEGVILTRRKFLLESALGSATDAREFTRKMDRIIDQLERDRCGSESPPSSQGGTPSSNLVRCFEVIDPFERDYP